MIGIGQVTVVVITVLPKRLLWQILELLNRVWIFDKEPEVVTTASNPKHSRLSRLDQGMFQPGTPARMGTEPDTARIQIGIRMKNCEHRLFNASTQFEDYQLIRGLHDLVGNHLKRLNFIRRARTLGFTLAQVEGLLALADSGDFACADVKTMTEAHRAEVRRKLADLRRLDRALKDLAIQCDGGTSQDCAIFDALFEGGK